jgi:formylglycine-generating enzyme required for sulfatase activity
VNHLSQAFAIALLSVALVPACATTDTPSPTPGFEVDLAPDPDVDPEELPPAEVAPEPIPDVPQDTLDADGSDLAQETISPEVVEAELPPQAVCPEVMGHVPAGTFLFGPPSQATEISHDYCVDLFEVTSAEFLVCVDAGGCEGYAAWEMCTTLDEKYSPNQCFPDRGEYPVNYIDWFRANAYCAWAGKRLPTPQEWERATRGDVGFTYPWGEDPLTCEHAHQGRGQIFDACLDYGGLANRPIEVGSYVAGVSPYGLFDTLGNVKEWVDIREDRSILPGDADKALARGGSYNEGEFFMTALAYDGQLGAGITSQGHGFRCVADPE